MRVIHRSNSTKKNSKSNINCNTYSNDNQPSESIQSSTINDSNARNSHSVLRHGLRFLGLYSYLKKLISSTVYGGHPLPWRSSTLDILDFSFKKKSPAKEMMISETEVNSVSEIDYNNYDNSNSNYNGYDNYYSLQELESYKNEEYKLDTELILNETFNELMFPTDTKFVDYLIAYSGHFPFTNKKEVCKMLYDKDREENNDDSEFKLMTEEECIRRQARETDDMVKLLVDKLQEKELLDKTVIMIFTDHYLYTIDDKTILERYKTTENNLINNTPWFIWSSDIDSKEVKSVTSQINILPTTLNLFGFSYNPNNYIGKDALSSNYKGLVFFSDYSWYDGNVYVESGEVTNGKSIKEEELVKKNNLVNDLARKNDLTLKYDHFKRIKNKS